MSSMIPSVPISIPARSSPLRLYIVLLAPWRKRISSESAQERCVRLLNMTERIPVIINAITVPTIAIVVFLLNPCER